MDTPEIILWCVVVGLTVAACLAVRANTRSLPEPLPLPTVTPDGTRAMVTRRTEEAFVRGQAEGAAAAINAMHRHLGLPTPLLVSLPSLRQHPLTASCADIGEYLDDAATERLDAVAYFVKEQGTNLNLSSVLDGLESDPGDEHYVMPQCPLDREALESSGG